MAEGCVCCAGLDLSRCVRCVWVGGFEGGGCIEAEVVSFDDFKR